MEQILGFQSPDFGFSNHCLNLDWNRTQFELVLGLNIGTKIEQTNVMADCLHGEGQL